MKMSMQLLIFLGLVFWWTAGNTTLSQNTANEDSVLFSGSDPCDSGQKQALLIFGEEPEDYEAREKTIQSLLAILKRADFADEKITILTNGNDDLRLRANKANILAALDRLRNDAGKTEGDQDRELFVYASLKTVKNDETPWLVTPSNANLDELILEKSQEVQYKPDRLINLRDEFIEPISQSPIERRLMVLNTISPQPQTRGGMEIRERGASAGSIASVSGNEAFGQIVITDSLRPGPGTVNSFVEILDKGLLGYADMTDSGNFNGQVGMNELLAYIERFGNMTSQGSVQTLFKGRDYNMVSHIPEKDRVEVIKKERLSYLEEMKKHPVTAKPGTSSPATPASSRGKWYCLLFSVNEFKNDVGLSVLDGPFHDMELLQKQWLIPLREQMSREWGVTPQDAMEIVVLSDKQRNADGNLVDRNLRDTALSTRDHFLKELRRITSKAGPNDFILVAVSCHGYAAQGRSVLCPYDLQRFPFNNVEGNPMIFPSVPDIRQTTNPISRRKTMDQITGQIDTHIRENNLIAVKEVIDLLAKSKAEKKLFLTDACRNNQDTTRSDFMTEFKTLMDSFYSGTDTKTHGLAVITSCSLGQKSIDLYDGYDGNPNGLFFKCFVEGLGLSKDQTGFCADQEGNLNGFVSLNEAYNYAFYRTFDEAFKKHGKFVQTPELFRGTAWDTFPLQWSSNRHANADSFATTDGYLVHQALLSKDAKDYAKSKEILTYLLELEPNNSTAYIYRSGVQLASLETSMQRQVTSRQAPVNPMPVYRSALADCKRIGRPLDLYAVIPPEKQGNIAPLYRTASTEKPILNAQGRSLGVYRNQKVSITAVNGDWLFVQRTGDNASQNGMGWIHRHYVTWSEKSVEQYRPSTPMNRFPQPPMERMPAYQGNPWRGPSGPMSPVTMPGLNR